MPSSNFWTYLTHQSGGLIVNFEHVFAYYKDINGQNPFKVSRIDARITFTNVAIVVVNNELNFLMVFWLPWICSWFWLYSYFAMITENKNNDFKD